MNRNTIHNDVRTLQGAGVSVRGGAMWLGLGAGFIDGPRRPGEGDSASP